MFTGLVREPGTVVTCSNFGSGRRIRIAAGAIAATARVGQSIAVNGVCLTATAVQGTDVDFDAMRETVERTNLAALRPGDLVNLEPALAIGDPLDGHIVQGHVDAAAPVLAIDSAHADNRIITISLPPALRHLVADKGSVAIDGISLTVIRADDDRFTIGVIPHTWANTTLCRRKPGDRVNIEADVLARYAARILRYAPGPGTGGVTMELLARGGFA